MSYFTNINIKVEKNVTIYCQALGQLRIKVRNSPVKAEFENVLVSIYIS